jgi:rod shape-determining protein MreD
MGVGGAMERRAAIGGGEFARVVIAALIWLFALAQGPIIQALFPLDVTPNVVLVLVVLWAGYTSVREGIVWAFVAGLFQDVLLFAPLGTHAFALMVVVLALEPIRRFAFGENHAWPLLVVFVAALLNDVVFLVVTHLARHGDPLNTLWRFSIARALTDVIAAVVLLPLVLLLRRWGNHGDLSAG